MTRPDQARFAAGSAPRPVSRAATRLSDFLALTVLALLAILLFRLHIFRVATFIGNPDRLNSFLNILKFHVDSLAAGHLLAWNEYMFMGFNTFALPYTFPNPFVYLSAVVGSSEIIRTAGFVSCALLVFAGWTSYIFIKDTCEDSFFALVGAALYQVSALSVLKVSQNDMSFAVIILIPLIMLALRRIKRGNAARCFAALAILFAVLLTFTFLQKAAYAVMLAGVYALYRTVWLRDWRPVIGYIAGLLTGIVAGVPRLWTVVEDLLLFRREVVGHDVHDFQTLYEFQNIRPHEFLRWFYDGIFGRFPEEAATLGNNINLTEGMLVYSSVFAAFLVVFGLVRYRDGWLRLLLFRDEDLSFHLVYATFCFAVVLVKPVAHLLYVLFLSIDFTHARVLVTAQLSLCTIVACVLRDLARPTTAAGSMFARRKVLLVGMVAAGVVLVAITLLAWRGKVDERILLNQSVYRLAGGISSVMVYTIPHNYPAVPPDIVAGRVSPTAAELTWRDVAGEDRYEIQSGEAGGVFTATHTAPADATLYRANDLRPGVEYVFRLRACRGMDCSPFSTPVSPPNTVSGRLAERPDSTKRAQEAWLLGSSVRRVGWSFLAFAFCLTLLTVVPHDKPMKLAVVSCLAFLMVFEAFTQADVRVNGKHARAASVPFRFGSSVMAKPGEFRSAGTVALQAFSQTLETSRFRTALVCDPAVFPAFCAPYLSQFWRLRMVEGYTSGVPARLASLSWPDGVRSLRAISFASMASLDWRLLSLLNVKYALVVNDAFYRNYVVTPEGGWRDVLPEDATIIRNPLPVTPREFFAGRVAAASSPSGAAATLFSGSRGDGNVDLTHRSVAEGLDGERAFATGGNIRATYHGDRIDITVDAANEPQFLVLNEAYHPRWRAFGGERELKVYSTNVVMRGIEVPPGVTSITVEFMPFVRSNAALAFLAGALLLLLSGYALLWRLDHRR